MSCAVTFSDSKSKHILYAISLTRYVEKRAWNVTDLFPLITKRREVGWFGRRIYSLILVFHTRTTGCIIWRPNIRCCQCKSPLSTKKHLPIFKFRNTRVCWYFKQMSSISISFLCSYMRGYILIDRSLIASFRNNFYNIFNPWEKLNISLFSPSLVLFFYMLYLFRTWTIVALHNLLPFVAVNMFCRYSIPPKPFSTNHYQKLH